MAGSAGVGEDRRVAVEVEDEVTEVVPLTVALLAEVDAEAGEDFGGWKKAVMVLLALGFLALESVADSAALRFNDIVANGTNGLTLGSAE